MKIDDNKKEERLNKIKQKYNSMEISDDVASKIRNLEITSTALKVLVGVVGVVTVSDFVIPDALPVIDEALLTALTALFVRVSKVIDKKIDDLVTTGNTKLTTKDLINIGSDLGRVAKVKKKIKKSK